VPAGDPGERTIFGGAPRETAGLAGPLIHGQPTFQVMVRAVATTRGGRAIATQIPKTAAPAMRGTNGNAPSDAAANDLKTNA
jgi:hypothetical protein